MRAHVSWVLAVLVVVAACSDDDPGSDPTPTPTPVATPPAMAEIDPSILEGMATETVSDFDQTVHATWPVIAGADELSRALGAFTQDRFGTFTAALPESSPRTPSTSEPDTAARPELNVSWSVIGASPDAVGVRLSSYEFFGASGGELWRTFWYDPASASVRGNGDLLAGDDARSTLAEAVRAALIRPDGEVSEDDLDAAMSDDSWPTAMGFADDGRLVVEFDQYSVASGSAGRVAAAIPADDTEELLSEFGVAAQQAAVAPADPALPVVTPEPTVTTDPEPTPEPEPTTAPEPTTEPEADVDCSTTACVAVTYDDGPARYTEQLLQVLEDKDAPATFFLLGQQMAAYPDTVRAMHAGGHEIANHTWDHKQLTTLSAAQVRAQFDRTSELLVEVTGSAPTAMRPPYGATNSAVADVAREAGLAQILWSVDTRDWADRDPAIVTRRVLDDAKAGSIILMHDIHSSTVQAAAAVVDGLRARGFTLVTVSDLFDEPLTPGERYHSR